MRISAYGHRRISAYALSRIVNNCCETRETQPIRATGSSLAAPLISLAYGDERIKHGTISGASPIKLASRKGPAGLFPISAAFQKRLWPFLRLIARYASPSRSDAASIALFPWITDSGFTPRTLTLTGGICPSFGVPLWSRVAMTASIPHTVHTEPPRRCEAFITGI